MADDLILEVAVDSVESAIAARQGGAHRIELFANLVEGGTTPSAGTIALARQHIDIGIKVMIRPRAGDFLYTEIEFELMKHEIEQAKQLGVDGVVFGLLTPEGAIDRERTAELVSLARPMHVTFHRAFDMTCDPFGALEALIGLGVDYLLTSGQKNSVIDGLDLIAELVNQANDQILVVPAGGITPQNINEVIRQTGASEVHVVSLVNVESQMSFRNTDVSLGGAPLPPEYARTVTPLRVSVHLSMQLNKKDSVEEITDALERQDSLDYWQRLRYRPGNSRII